MPTARRWLFLTIESQWTMIAFFSIGSRTTKEIAVRKHRQTLTIVMGVCAILCAASLAVLNARSTPVLYTTSESYCGLYNPGWGIYGVNADPYEDVEYIEYKWNGYQWNVIWGPEVVASTHEDGTFEWYTYGPSSAGYYYSRVTVNGQTSNEAYFSAGGSCG